MRRNAPVKWGVDIQRKDPYMVAYDFLLNKKLVLQKGQNKGSDLL